MTNCPTEEWEQITLMRWVKLNEARCPQLKLLFHVPNGGKRNAREAARFKEAGVKPGVPDLFLPIASNGYHGLFIELKRTKGAVVSPAQERWLHDLAGQGYAAVVCRGWQEAADEIMRYLNDR